MTLRSRPLSLFGLVVAGGLVAVVAGSRFAHRPFAGFSTDSRSSKPARSGVSSRASGGPTAPSSARWSSRAYRPRHVPLDTSGFGALPYVMRPWGPAASLEEISQTWQRAGFKGVAVVDQRLGAADRAKGAQVADMILKAALLNYEGEVEQSYTLLRDLRSIVEGDDRLAQDSLGSVIYFQGVDALRIGENDNCIMCREETSCILPISSAAVHMNPRGSRLAIDHFTEYLHLFPDDLEVRWLINLAYMTLGEYPDKVQPEFRLDLARFFKSEFDIGKFRDASRLVGINRINQAGGAIMDDFDNDGLLDIAVTSFDSTQSMALYGNRGDGTFEDRTKQSKITGQLGGMVCYQADYNNDGRLDIFIPRGAWVKWAVRPTLLRNDGDDGFVDVTEEAGLLIPLNSIAACWGDYDNDGSIDLFVGCERQQNLLFRNKGNGTFEEVAARVGVEGRKERCCKGCTWIDFDNDGFSDLFLDHLDDVGRLYRNNRDGTFTEVTSEMGIDGPYRGFSCWTWDYDNDGWLDIFGTCYDRSTADVVKGLLGQAHGRYSNRLFRNSNGKGFENVTKEAGLDMVFETMGSNFGDFDNDGFLDMYLGTGEPSLATLVPNRMFKNVGGKRFAEISASTGTGHLQKGHGIACGDWDRDGDVDLFVETGGAVNGDKYHNVLFQNPGQGNHWLTVKLVGKQTNRAAIGARIKLVTGGENPLTIHRHVSSGSSFGANPLQQTIGLAKAQQVVLLEVCWPTSGTTQVFRDIAADQSIEVTEFAEAYRPLSWNPIPHAK